MREVSQTGDDSILASVAQTASEAVNMNVRPH